MLKNYKDIEEEKILSTEKKWVLIQTSSDKMALKILDNLGIEAHKTKFQKGYITAHISEFEFYKYRHKIYDNIYFKVLGLHRMEFTNTVKLEEVI